MTGALRNWAVDLGIATAGGFFLGLLGPFGSYFNGPLWQRALFEIVCFWIGTLLFGTGVRLLSRLKLSPAWQWAAIVVMTAVLTAPFSFVVSALARLFWPFLAHVPHLTPWSWYLQGVATAEPVVLGFSLLIRLRMRADAARAEAPASAPPPPSSKGLLGAAPAEVLCLQMEDHYVRVHTAAGSRLVLASLRQAMEALEAAEGLQTHRSWWVARQAVAGAEAHGRNLRLRLSNGLSVPVARSAVAVVRAAGWVA